MVLTAFYLALAGFLLLMILIGLIRVLRGPTRFDRMLTAQLFGTTAVAILLLLSEGTGEAAMLDVALVFALLSAVAAVAFTVLNHQGAARRREGKDGT